MRRGLATALVLTAALAAALVLGGPKHRPAPAPAARLIPAPPAAITAAPPTAAANPVAVAADRLDVRAWRGTDIDGDIDLDAGGRVIPDRALRELFDYLLSARNQLTMAQIDQRLDTIAQAHRLDPAQRTALRERYMSYVDYLQAAADLHIESTDLDGLQRLYDARYALRRNLLGTVAADGYFADSEAQDRYVLETIAITRDQTLSGAQRQQRLAAARARAPLAVQQSEASADALSALAEGSAAIRAAGGNAAQLQALRERTVGVDAALRLQALDQENAAWAQRVQDFSSAWRSLEANTGLSSADRRSQREALIAREFSAPEARRLRAQLGLDPGPP